MPGVRYASHGLRILHVSTRLILGGSQENTVLSCEGQARLGHEVHLAFGPIYGPEGSLLERVRAFRTGDGRGITTHVVPHLCREVSPLKDRKAVRAFVEQRFAERPPAILVPAHGPPLEAADLHARALAELAKL